MSTAVEIADAARAEIADLTDLQLLPLGQAAIAELAPASGQIVLDVGCGAGGSILLLTDRVGTTGRVIGVDIGRRVLAVASARTKHLPHVTLVEDDAAQFQHPSQSIDAIYSGFGVMFFADPVRAFANLKRMLRPGGRLAFVCWRSLQENELDAHPLQAAKLDIAIDDTPFSFEDPQIIRSVLGEAGFRDISMRKHDASVSCGGLEETLQVATTVGPLGKVLRETPSLMDDVKPRVREALSSRVRGGAVYLKAATWLVSAA
ncbi:MAG: class I SAM-dependent methyltransferase [Pseudomonadota bacterium]